MQTILWLRAVLLMVPEQQETIHMIQMLRKEACSGCIAHLSHIRTQWCLTECLTKKAANPQNLTDAVRQGVFKEVDAPPPFRSLVEHKAYLRSWLPTVCSHVDFRHDVFLLGDTLRDSWLFFEFVPAAQEVIESRRSHGFFTMSSSNRWNRTSAAEAPSSSSDRRRQEFPDSQYDDELRHSEPTEGYAQRKHEEVPHERLRTPATFPTEDHMAFSAGYRFNTAWFNDSEFVNKKRERNMHCIHEPNNMNPFDRHQMCMDVISWILYWGTEHEEVDVAIKWLAEFLKFLCGYTTQEEENWFDGHIDLTNKNKNYSRYLKCSKALARELRHSSKKYLFDPRGGMNITDLFDLMEGTIQNIMACLARSLQHFCCAIPNEDSLLTSTCSGNGIHTAQGQHIHSMWDFVAHKVIPTKLLILGPYIIHWHMMKQCVWDGFFMWQRNGLKTNPKGSGRAGRDAVHFM